jgi:hypothetical protein
LSLGINDASACQSVTSDDLLTDQDQSVFGDSSTTDGPDEQTLDDIDDDSFEVLSFEAPPENSLYFKGIFQMTHFLFYKKILSLFRISIYHIKGSK